MKKILDSKGNIVCFLSEETAQIRIFTYNQTYKGRYDRHTDRTFKANGELVGTGNQLFTLI